MTLRLFSLLLLVFAFDYSDLAQTPSFRIAEIAPYPEAVPGLILEAKVEGLTDSPTALLNTKDLTVEVTQNGTKFQVPARSARSTFVSVSKGKTLSGPPDFSNMRAFYSIGFVVPQGLQTGKADVAVVYLGRRSDSTTLTIVDRPPTPRVSLTTFETISTATASRRISSDMGLRLERGGKAQLHVSPLVDPNDLQTSIVVRFQQGEGLFNASGRVIHEDAQTQQLTRGVRFGSARDFFEVLIPASLQAGAAELELSLSANGQAGDVVRVPVLITDATRVAELPAENAPRSLAVSPTTVGVGQALMISVDHLRTLNPNPAGTMVMFEKDGVRYTVRPELNSAVMNPAKDDDAPVFLIARPTRQIIGDVKLYVFNAARGEQGGLSAATHLKIVDEVFPPQLISVAESTASELTPLRQMYEIQQKAGREFPEYNPANRYLSIRVRGLDMNPKFCRIALKQGDQSTELGFRDFSSMSGELLIVRLPAGLRQGPIELSIQNKGAEKDSEVVTKSFELSH